MSNWIKASSNDMCFLLFSSLLIKLNSHSYGLFVPSHSCLWFYPTRVDSYHSKYILYVNHEVHKLGKYSMLYS